MSERIEAALTSEEWANVLESCDENGCASADVASLAMAGRFSAAAAVALYGTKHGFTQEEVKALIACLPGEPNVYEERCSPDARTLNAAWKALDKIMALLPPPPSTETRPDE